MKVNGEGFVVVCRWRCRKVRVIIDRNKREGREGKGREFQGFLLCISDGL